MVCTLVMFSTLIERGMNWNGPYTCLVLLSSLILRFNSRFVVYWRNHQFAVLGIDLDEVAIVDGAVEDGAGNTVFDLALDDAFEWSRTKLWVIAFACQQIFCGIAD